MLARLGRIDVLLIDDWTAPRFPKSPQSHAPVGKLWTNLLESSGAKKLLTLGETLGTSDQNWA
jgi:hypothetical protein